MDDRSRAELQALRVVVGYRCNYRCTFCYQQDRGGRFLRLERLASVVASLGFAPRFVTLMGGEPTLYPDLIPAVRLLRGACPGAELSLTTNGSAAVDLYLALDAAGLDNLTFSLQSLDERRYAELTGGRGQALPDYLEKILRVRARARAKVRLNAYVVPGEVEGLYRFCKAHGLKLTFCEDLVSRSAAQRQALPLPPGVRRVVEHPLRRVYADSDGFEFWNYKHLDAFDYDNLIVLPDGSATLDFADVLAQRGALVADSGAARHDRTTARRPASG